MYTYTAVQLQSKTFGQLKLIACELDIVPTADRRCRQNWIDAIAGVNPPLLQLLEVSPAAEAQQPIIETVETSTGVEPETQLESKFGRLVYPRSAQGAIELAAKTAIGVDVDSVQKPFMETVESSTGVDVDPVQESIKLAAETSPGVEVEQAQEFFIETVEASPGVEVEQAQEPITEAAKTSPGVEVDRALSHKFLLCLKEGHNTLWYDGKNFVCEKWSAKTYCKRGVGAAKHQLRCHPEVKRLGNLQVVENSPADQKLIEVQATEPIEPAAKTSPGAEVDRVPHPIIEMVETFPAASVEQAQEAIAPAAKNLPGSRLKTSTAHQLLELFKSSAHIIEDFPGVQTEVTVSESAIAPAAKNHLDAVESEHPKSKGITFSDRFLARYSPPQAEIVSFQPDADGQLSLLDFKVQSEPEPPDPDDFESLNAFREAIALWEWEHNEVSSEHNESLEVSLDSFCEWAPCPADWYEPAALDGSSKVMEPSKACRTSITSDFFIPRTTRHRDLCKIAQTKTPQFFSDGCPPSAGQTHTKLNPNASQTHTYCIAAGSSTQPARSPPGGHTGF